MIKITGKKAALSFLFIAAGILFSLLSFFVPVSVINAPVPMIVTGSLITFLILNTLVLSKATARQLIVLSILNFIFFNISYIPALYIAGNLQIVKDAFISNNAAVNFIAVIFSLLSGYFAASIYYAPPKKKQIISKQQAILQSGEQTIQAVPDSPKEDVQLQSATVEVASSAKPAYSQEQIIPPVKEIEPEPKPELEQLYGSVAKADIDENKEEPEIILSLNNSSKSEEKKAGIYEPIEEDIPEDIQIKTEDNTNINELPNINLADIEEPAKTLNQQPKKEIPPEPVNKEFISRKIRLIEDDSSSKKETSSTGKISSISNLLVNTRDFENIIEINELFMQMGCDISDSNVVSFADGLKIYEKFNKILAEHNSVQDIALINYKGYIIAGVFDNKEKQENIAAIIACMFFAVKNFLLQIKIPEPVKIIFEADDISYVITKYMNNVFFYSLRDNEIPSQDGILSELLNQKTFTNSEIDAIKASDGVKTALMTDEEGNLIYQRACISPEEYSGVASALFENLRIVIKNIQPTKLKRIVISETDKIITIQKFTDKLIMIISDLSGPIKISGKLTEIENLLN